MSEKSGFCLISFHRVAFDGEITERLIRSLRFGERETDRLLKIKNSRSLALSLSSLLCLQELVSSLELGDHDLAILRDANGKPRFESLPLHFSISHSNDVCAVALSSHDIGIDLEFIDSSRNTSAIAKRFFSADECQSIECARSPVDAFFREWTKKEAIAKLLGEGLVSICANSVKKDENRFFEYELELDGNRAALAVCTSIQSFDTIEIRNPYDKEIKIYEIQN